MEKKKKKVCNLPNREIVEVSGTSNSPFCHCGEIRNSGPAVKTCAHQFTNPTALDYLITSVTKDTVNNSNLLLTHGLFSANLGFQLNKC